MKPTKFLTLLMPTIVSWSVVYVLVKLMLQNGAGIPVATPTVMVTLASIAVIEALIAIPIFRYRSELQKFVKTGVRPKRIDPFYAMRVLVLAKATAIAGAIFLGATLSLVFTQLSQPVVADSIWQNQIGIDGNRVPNMGEHWQVVVRVAVCVASLQTNVPLFGKLLHRLVLGFSVQRFAD